MPQLRNWIAAFIPFAAILALIVCSSLLPRRGLADRLAGTHPVPN
jgi:hypothetical protein